MSRPSALCRWLICAPRLSPPRTFHESRSIPKSSPSAWVSPPCSCLRGPPLQHAMEKRADSLTASSRSSHPPARPRHRRAARSRFTRASNKTLSLSHAPDLPTPSACCACCHRRLAPHRRRKSLGCAASPPMLWRSMHGSGPKPSAWLHLDLTFDNDALAARKFMSLYSSRLVLNSAYFFRRGPHGATLWPPSSSYH